VGGKIKGTQNRKGDRMSLDSTCIFCKIIQGEIPSARVYENEKVLAFLDISQVTKGHTLVIPKVHMKDIFEMSAEVAADLFSVVPEIATTIKKQCNADGVNVLNNNGETAGQTVFHPHIHIIPRYGRQDGFHPTFQEHNDKYTGEDLQKIAAQITAGFKL
jgi:histidine triad (HIT) family protein